MFCPETKKIQIYHVDASTVIRCHPKIVRRSASGSVRGKGPSYGRCSSYYGKIFSLNYC